MHYNKKQLLQIIADKDLSESSLSQIFNVNYYSDGDNYEFLIQLLQSDYLFLAKHVLSKIQDFVTQNPDKFTKLRELIPHKGEFDLIMNNIESNLNFQANKDDILDFNKFINLNKLNLKFCYQIADKNQYKDILKKLDFLKDFQISEIKIVENYLNNYLQIHKQDINYEKNKLLDEIKSYGFDLQNDDIYQYQIPKIEFTASMDGTLDMANKNEFFIYKSKEHLVEKDKILENPYFLFITNQKNDYFIGKRYYKDAITSYTSNFARSIRYANDSSYDYVDLLIKDSQYQKIFIRNSENKNQINVDGDENEIIQEKVEKSSGIADISNLLTDYQDLIFRSPLRGLVLVEGVAGSGKTNLIFHRIDYLLQEYPDNFKKENIGIIVKNIYLKEYMISALGSTDFGFKDDVKVNIFSDLILQIIQNNSNFDLQKLNFETDKDIQTEFKKIEKYISKYFRDLLNQNINILKQYLIQEFQDYLQDINDNSSTNNIMIKGLESQGNRYLQGIRDQINNFEINQQKSFYHNLDDLQRIIQNNIEKIQNKGILSDRKIELLEEDIEAILQKFKQGLLQDIMQSNKIYLNNNLLNIVDNYYLNVMFLLYCIFEQVQDRSILPIYDYVLVDEFQDFSYPELYFLNRFYSSMVWSGDLTQSTLYHDTDILQKFEIVDKKVIQDNFRNTLETVKFANEILKNCKIYNLNVKRVNRRGQKPFVIDGNNLFQIQDIIKQSIANNEKLGIAYLDKNIVQKIIKNNKLFENDYYFDLQKQKHFNNNYKIYFFDYANIKGLEFDNVILLDVDKLIGDDLQDSKLKLFYIGITRAVKKLYISIGMENIKKLDIKQKLFN